MKNLNLCTDPWLPVRMCAGNCLRVSLEDFFSMAHEISDLILAAHERIAIMRLLICIAQRAINGPMDRDEWEDCKEEIPTKALEYLQKWRPAFNLLGEDGAFLQFSGVNFHKGTWKGLSKLNLSLAEGNNPTLFDNEATIERRVELWRLAIDLITFQNFAPQGIIGQVNWYGTPYPESTSARDAPCIVKNAVHMFFVGKNILETIWLNLCTEEQINSVFNSIGKPVWECMPNGLDDEQSIENASKTYLGRLVPLSRLVKIEYSLNRCLVSMGIVIPSYSEEDLLYFEPFTTIELTSDNKGTNSKRRIISAEKSCDLWRNLPAHLHRFNSKGYTLGYLEPTDMPSHYGVWIGGMVSEKAKIVGVLEDYYEHLAPQSIDSCLEPLHQLLFEYANRGCDKCCIAVKKYYELLTKKNVEHTNDIKRIKHEYWCRLTLHKEIYVNLIRLKKEDREWEKELNSWITAICDSAKEVYQLYAPRDNERRLAAWSQALRYLPHKAKLLKHEK